LIIVIVALCLLFAIVVGLVSYRRGKRRASLSPTTDTSQLATKRRSIVETMNAAFHGAPTAAATEDADAADYIYAQTATTGSEIAGQPPARMLTAQAPEYHDPDVRTTAPTEPPEYNEVDDGPMYSVLPTLQRPEGGRAEGDTPAYAPTPRYSTRQSTNYDVLDAAYMGTTVVNPVTHDRTSSSNNTATTAPVDHVPPRGTSGDSMLDENNYVAAPMSSASGAEYAAMPPQPLPASPVPVVAVPENAKSVGSGFDYAAEPAPPHPPIMPAYAEAAPFAIDTHAAPASAVATTAIPRDLNGAASGFDYAPEAAPSDPPTMPAYVEAAPFATDCQGHGPDYDCMMAGPAEAPISPPTAAETPLPPDADGGVAVDSAYVSTRSRVEPNSSAPAAAMLMTDTAAAPAGPEYADVADS